MKKILKFVLKIVVGFIVFILLYMLSAYALSKVTIHKETSATEDISIYILTNGVHTDIVVPIKYEHTNWSTEVKFSNTNSKDTEFNYVSMGWGDKGFYLETPEWKDLKMLVAFKAAFALSHSAIHATFYKAMVESERCKKISISKSQLQRLTKFISESFQRDTNGHFINISTNAVYGSNDAFYEANGSYSLFYTCNTWANNALKACGQTCCLWTPFDTGIFQNYE